MISRLSICLALVLALGTVRAAFADKTHEGTVVSVTQGVNGADGKLMMKEKDSTNEHEYMIPTTVKISLNKKKVELKDLKKGDEIKLTTDDGGRVKEIVATRKSTSA